MITHKFYSCLDELCDPYKGFLDSSVGKESACTADDPGSISGSGRWRRDRLVTIILPWRMGYSGK